MNPGGALPFDFVGPEACDSPSDRDIGPCPMCQVGGSGALPTPGPNTSTCPQATDLVGLFNGHLLAPCIAFAQPHP